MGHSDIKMVTRYAHPTQQHQLDAIKKMQAKKPKNETGRTGVKTGVQGVITISTTVPFGVGGQYL